MGKTATTVERKQPEDPAKKKGNSLVSAVGNAAKQALAIYAVRTETAVIFGLVCDVVRCSERRFLSGLSSTLCVHVETACMCRVGVVLCP